MPKIGMVVGHGKSKKGGYDSGAVGNGYHEFQLAKECAKYAAEYLNSSFHCETDLFNYAGDTYLDDRIKKFQDHTYDLIAEIHLNAGGGTGPEVYYSKGNAEGKTAAENISAQIAADFSLRNRGAKTKLKLSGKDYFAFIRETVPTAVLVETLFIDAREVFLVNTPDGQKKMGKAIAKGIAKALGLAEKEQADPHPTPEPILTVGSTVRVKNGAKSYEGKKIAPFVFDRVYRVDELKGDRAVLDRKGICTAFHVKDLTVEKAVPSVPEPSQPVKKISVGSKVKVKQGAKSYEGKKIASFVYQKTYTVDQIKGDRAVLDLKGLCTAFHLDDLEAV